MKILNIIQVLIKTSGAVRSMLATAKYSSKLGKFQHSILYLERAEQKAIKIAEAAGIRVITKPNIDILKEEIQKTDIVHVHFWNNPHIYQLLRSELPAMRLLINFHIAGDGVPQIITKKLIDHADMALATSPYTYEQPAFQNLPRELREQKTGMVYGATDFARLSGYEARSHNTFNVGYIGTVDFMKMHPNYVAMSASIKIRNIKFIVCGNGCERLKPQIQSLEQSVAAKFDIRGYVEDIKSVIEVLDVLGYPLCENNYSSAELVLQEAMYCGVPPVVFAYGGAQRIVIHNETGLIVNNELEYRQVIEYLYLFPEERQRLGRNAQKYARENFGAENAAKGTNHLYEKMMKFPKRKREWGISRDLDLLNEPCDLDDLIGYEKPSGADLFIESLGGKAPQFNVSMNSNNVEELLAADRKIAESPPLLCHAGGGVFPYKNYYQNDGYLRFWWGLILQQQENHNEAIAEFTGAINLGCDNWRVYWYLSQSCLKVGEKLLAESYLQKVVRLYPYFVDAKQILDSIKRPKLSIVFSGRNDSYGNNFKERVLAAWKRNYTEMQKRGIEVEWIFVEWNPLNKDYFAYTLAALGFKCYVVSPEIHQKICTNPNMTFLQFFAKNVGMRRASNDWILVTNADVVFGDDILDFISKNQLDNQVIYRAQRRDIKPGLYDKSFEKMIENTIINYPINNLKNDFGKASGDFTLYHKDTIDFGYDENITDTDIHPDTRFIANFIAKNKITDYKSHFKFIGTVFKENHHMSWRNTMNLENNRKGYNKGEYISENLPYESSSNWGLTDYSCLEIGKNVGKIGRIKMAHIINPVIVKESSDLYIAQPITFATMKTAQKQAAGKVDVSIYTAQYPEDYPIIPEDFIKTPDLDRSILDIAEFQIPRKLPLIKDILDRLYQTAVDADYLIYTNTDIGLQPHFYTEVAKIIEQGYDAFVINRRTISGHYQDISQIPQMYAEKGVPHPGHDCFVFKRSLYRKFVLGFSAIGTGLCFRPVLLNCLCNANKFQEFADLYLTFHIGNQETWKSGKFTDYEKHNKYEAQKIFDYYFHKKLLPNHRLIKQRFSQFMKTFPLTDAAFKMEIIGPETLVASPGKTVIIEVISKNKTLAAKFGVQVI